MATDNLQHGRGIPLPLKLALALAIVGALNWGLIGFFNWNLVDAIFGGDANEMTSGASRVIYALVGLAGLASVYVFSYRTAEQHRLEPAPHSR